MRIVNSGGADDSKKPTKIDTVKTTPSTKSNPVVYFEIPVTDIDRAIKFYSTVFNCKFDKDSIDKNEIALFPFEMASPGISGALAKGEIYKPTKEGVLNYFNLENKQRLKEYIRLSPKIACFAPKNQHFSQFVKPKL